MARRHGKPDGFPVRLWSQGEVAGGSKQFAEERVHLASEVVAPLLRRADLVSQLLRIGYAYDPQKPEPELSP